MADIKAQLEEHLKNADEWGKMETPIPGVFVVKVPATKTRPALLFLEVNPLKENGKPMKRKGLFVRDYEMAIKFAETLQDDKTIRLIKELEEINPDQEKTKKLKM
ncbi:MAG: hypothetical protein GF317_16255 [Candidatus Lokiarchaeota archaeon]|nr:hypothetical protein [Candidatus Lokiarchaeota archaeon]MBD3201087.1 hypothetical protein [Candidatus Lokiarchaeota archaeon]